MALNIDKMRKQRAEKEAKRNSGDWFNPKNGEHLLYVAGVCREDDDLNYVEVMVHYGVGPKNNMCVCLTPKVNGIVKDSRVSDLITDKDISDGCPVCREWEKLAEQIKDAEKAKPPKKSLAEELKKQQSDIKRNTRFLFNVIPFGFRKKSSEAWEEPDEPKVAPFMCGSMVWEGILDVIMTEGDITNPDKATLVRLVKSGEGMTTKYKVTADSDSIRAPKQLSKALKAQLREGLKEGGTGDLYRMTADMVRSSEEVEALLSGVEVEEGEGDGKDEPPACFKMDYTNDAECKTCPWRGPCSSHLGKKLYPGHELKEGDHGFDDPAEPEEEQEPEEPEPPKSKADKRAAESGGKGKSAKSAKSEAAAADDDEGLDALERELAKRGKK